MQEINIGWKNITLRKYFEYQKGLITFKNDSNLHVRLLSILEDIDYDLLKEYPVYLLESKFENWQFLADDFTKYEVKGDNVLDLGGKIYSINKSFGTLKFGQWQDLDQILNRSEVDKDYFKNIHILIAISSILPSEYSLEKAMELSELLLDEPMFFIIPNLNFFLHKEVPSIENIITYLRMIQKDKVEEVEFMIISYRTYIKGLGGIRLWLRLRTMILLSLMRLWILQYKKYSLI